MCDDWAHGGYPGHTWQANYTNLGTHDLSQVRFNQMSTALLAYDEAGWLLLQTESYAAKRVDGHELCRMVHL